MNRLYGVILIALSFLISGCVQKITNDNSSKFFEFGNKNNYINKVTYINNDKSIIFYIDSKKYSNKFNLCDDKASDCNSYFEFNKTDNSLVPYYVSYSFVFPDRTKQEILNNNLSKGINYTGKDTIFKVE